MSRDQSSTVKRIVKVKAEMGPRNSRSLKLLTKLGFKGVGRAEKTFETEEGWADSTYLELDLITL